jgi:N-acetyl-anhydromuramyl-L-alanine amidase AmpD
MALITSHDYHWVRELSRRSYGPPGIVWHHAAGTGSPDDIHRAHVRIGDSGIAYHFYVRRNGRIYRGRPEWAWGAHCLHHNDWLGVCAEGNYEARDDMPAAQRKALRNLHSYLHHKYPGIPDRRHRDMPGNATACPGRHFPFADITKPRPRLTGTVLKVPVPVTKPAWWKKLRAYLSRTK